MLKIIIKFVHKCRIMDEGIFDIGILISFGREPVRLETSSHPPPGA